MTTTPITDTCGLTRWHPFLRASAPSRSCLRAAGHDGMCRDGLGGQFEGTPSRPRALTSEEVDAANRAAFAEDDQVDAAPVYARITAYNANDEALSFNTDTDAADYVTVATPTEALDFVAATRSAFRWAQDHQADTGYRYKRNRIEYFRVTRVDANGSSYRAFEVFTRTADGVADGSGRPVRAAKTVEADQEKEASESFGSPDFAEGILRAALVASEAAPDTSPVAEDVAACPVDGCALLAGHSGPHMSLDAIEWKDAA